MLVPPFSLLKQPQEGVEGQGPVRWLKRLQGILHLLSGIKPARNRCLQLRSASRFLAIPGYSSLFLCHESFTAGAQSRPWNRTRNTETEGMKISFDVDEFIVHRSQLLLGKLCQTRGYNGESNSLPFTIRRLFLSIPILGRKALRNQQRVRNYVSRASIDRGTVMFFFSFRSFVFSLSLSLCSIKPFVGWK